MGKIKIYGLLIATLAIVLSLAACSGGVNRGDSPRTLMVSIPPQQYFLEQLAGNKFQVKCMLSKGGNPETYEPSMSYMMNLEKCDAYFFIGNIGFEAAIKGKVKEFNPNIQTFNSTEGIQLLKGGHHFDAGDKEGIDPHVWNSVVNARVIVRNMFDALVEIDAKNRDYYMANYVRFDKELKQFGDSLARELAPIKGEAFVVWHPSLSYFARDYGLKQISVEYEGKEAPVKFIEQRTRMAKSQNARVFLLQKGFDTRQAESVNAELGLKIVDINPLNLDWKGEMKHIADALVQQ